MNRECMTYSRCLPSERSGRFVSEWGTAMSRSAESLDLTATGTSVDQSGSEQMTMIDAQLSAGRSPARCRGRSCKAYRAGSRLKLADSRDLRLPSAVYAPELPGALHTTA